MLNLIRRQLAHDWPLVVAVMIVLATFEYLLCAMVGSVDVEGAFGEITRYAPPLLRNLIERNMPGGSPAAVLAFGWNHPVVHALLAAVAITLAARAIAGEVESGAIELVMAQPLSRAQYFTAHLAWAIVALCSALVAGMAGMALGQRVFGLPAFAAGRMAALFVNALLLQLSIYGIALAASAFAREAGRAAIVGVLVAVVSFLVNVVATLWTRAAFAKPYSLHHYYEPREILADGHLATSSVIVLALVAIVTIATAFTRFSRRDLP